ncbi:hypothetical protein P691DRAFT_627336, partial [Macrolepiota fuliginosa MF-IS2]
IPASRSFIKIVDVPYFKSGSTDPFTSTEVDAQLQRSIIPSDFVVHWRYVRNSPKANSATVWIDLSDSQRGSRASALIGRTLFLNGGTVTIRGAKAHTGTPQCQRCWKWGHTTGTCRHPAIRCPTCSGLHTQANHRSIAGCCRGNPKASPPIPPTPADAPCSHVRPCINCSNPHAANDRRCPYWRHHFNRAWIKDR